MAETVKKNDFVALRYTGYADGTLFDSNEEENIKKLHPDAEARETVVVVGQGMLVSGLDKMLEGKELGKRYEVSFGPGEGFGERRREFVKTIPLRVFTEKNIEPRAGMALVMDNIPVRIITVSGARVITDFNNPLAGKALRYEFTLTRRITSEDEKIRALLGMSFRHLPDFTIAEKITLRGPKVLESYVERYGSMFKELLGKELAFEFEEKFSTSDDNANEHAHEHTHSHEHVGEPQGTDTRSDEAHGV